MNKKYAITLVTSFFIVLTVGGIALAINGKLPFGDGFLKLSATIKSVLYLPIQEDSTVLSGTFDINPNLYVPKNNSDSTAYADALPNSDVSETVLAENSLMESESPEKEADLNLSESTGYLIVGDKLMQMCTTHEDNLKIYADNLNRLKSYLPDTTVISMVVPNSFPFYAPKQYITPDVNQKSMIESLYSKLNFDIKTVDAFSILEKNLEDYNYFRTDHHWTARGAYYGYTAFCETMGLTPAPLPSEPSGVLENYIGTTYKSLQQYPQAQVAQKNPDYIEYYIPDTAHKAFYYHDAMMKNGQKMKVIQTNLSAVDDKYLIFLEGMRPIIHIGTEVKNGESILIIKDSYANALVPFMLEQYEDIYVVDFRNFNAPNLPAFNAVKFVEDNSVDAVMVINYPYVPNDKAHSEHIGKMIPYRS